MATDNTKLNYDSEWDIDQLYATDTVSVPIGITTIYTIVGSLPLLPLYEVQFQPTGTTKWYQAGAYSTAGTLATSNSFYTGIIGNGIFIKAPVAGRARYFVWTDKVDY